MTKGILTTITLLFTAILLVAQQPDISEKTLVVWTKPYNVTQQGGSALTIDDGASHFDGIVFGEIEQGKWMAGSNNFARTNKQQGYSSEKDGETVKISIVYTKEEVILYRNDKILTQYPISQLQNFPSNSAIILFGLRHIDAGDKQNSYQGEIFEARIYDKALNATEIKNLNRKTVFKDNLWAHWDFSKGIQEQTGKFNSYELLKGASIAAGKLILEGKGATFIAKSSSEIAAWTSEKPVPKEVIMNTRTFREKLLNDPYRPAFHFTVPEDNGYPGDPNGAFYYKGRYHLMYLYNRENSGFSWGHVSSADLVHWRHHPDAIGPGNGDEGCFSGGAFVDDDGSAYLSYWMLWDAKGIGLAKSEDENFDNWSKLAANPVIQSTEWGVTQMKDEKGKDFYVGSADPSNIWKEDGKYYMLAGNLLVLNKLGRNESSPEDEKGDRLYLFSSDNLKDWTFEHRFYESDRKWTKPSEDNMCPSFFPLPLSPNGGELSDKHLLLFISHNLGCQYYIGSYNDHKFSPEEHGRMTWVDNSYFAPEALVDDKGRQIMWSWIFDDRPAEIRTASGWTGTYGLPRSLWLGEDGTLRMAPVEELKMLRMNEKSGMTIKLNPSKEMDYSDLSSELMELEIEAKIVKGDKFVVKLGVDSENSEETIITYDDEAKTLQFDTRRSSIAFGKKVIETAPFDLKDGETLKLRIFVDKSIIEVFANDRQAIGRRVYPTKRGTGISISSEKGNAEILTIKSWEMSPSNPY